jgi:hypothetical protein
MQLVALWCKSDLAASTAWLCSRGNLGFNRKILAKYLQIRGRNYQNNGDFCSKFDGA